MYIMLYLITEYTSFYLNIIIYMYIYIIIY